MASPYCCGTAEQMFIEFYGFDDCSPLADVRKKYLLATDVDRDYD
jgi:hypothetical protein